MADFRPRSLPSSDKKYYLYDKNTLNIPVYEI